MSFDSIISSESHTENMSSKEGKNKRTKRLILISSIALVTLCSIGLMYYLIFVNTARVTAAATDFSVVKPLQVDFNKKVSHEAAVSVKPAADYEIKWTDSLISSSVQIVPKSRWRTGTKYNVRLGAVETVLKQRVPDLNYSFLTQTAPKIVSSIPAKDGSNVAVDSELVLKLDSPNENLISPQLTFTPEAKYQLKLAPDKMSYAVKFDEKLLQSTTYKLSVSDNYRHLGNTGLGMYDTSFTTVPKVQISNFAPSGHMNYKNSVAKIVFDNDMDEKSVESAFSVDPATDGTMSWQDNRTLVFTPKSSLALNSNFNFKVLAGAKNTLGGVLEADYTNSFGTIGYVSASLTPSWGATEVGVNSAVRVYFNQDIDHSSAQNSFSISPNVSGNFSWNGNTMTFSPSGQAYLTRYQVTEKAGVHSVNGLDSAQGFSTSYTTLTPVNILNVTFHRQNYYLSCEAASLKMALGEKGVNVSEDNLFGLIGFDGPSQLTDGKWGNPNRGFVGNVNGNGTTTGYGVYWDPIARAGSAYRSTHAFTGGSLQTLTGAIDGGNPVVIWGTTGNPYAMSWTDSSTGGTVSAVKGEHARVVKGYRGLASNPIGFYIVDPIYGNLYWDSSTLLGNWSWFGNAGVIVY